MSLRRRLKLLEAKAPDPGPDPPHGYPTVTAVVREHDGLIRRLDEQTRELEEDPGGYVEGCDDARYGETLEEHEARVGALMDALKERDEAWRCSRRPDLVGVPNEIDDHIARLNREIEEIKAEGGGGGR